MAVTKHKTHLFVIITFVSLYAITSLISMIHAVEFFKLSNPTWLAIALAGAYEIGAAASLAALAILKRLNKSLVWFLFIALTAMQAMGNMYFSFTHLQNFTPASQLFGIDAFDVIMQKRIWSAIIGGMLPLIALGFIKSLIDYIKPNEKLDAEEVLTDEDVNAEDEKLSLVKDNKKDTNKKYIKKEKPGIKKDTRHPLTTPGVNKL